MPVFNFIFIAVLVTHTALLKGSICVNKQVSLRDVGQLKNKIIKLYTLVQF
jgi:hypothetical protein